MQRGAGATARFVNRLIDLPASSVRGVLLGTRGKQMPDLKNRCMPRKGWARWNADRCAL